MRADRIDAYWQAITILEAQELLVQCKAGDFPHLGKKERQTWHRQLHQQAYPRTWGAPRGITTEELAQRLGVLNG